MSTPSQHGYYYPEFIGVPTTSDNVTSNAEKNYSYHGIYHQRPKNYPVAEPSIYTVQRMNQGSMVEAYPNSELGSNVMGPFVNLPPTANALDHNSNQVPQQPPHFLASSNLLSQNNHNYNHSLASRNHQHQLSSSSTGSSATLTSVNSNRSLKQHSRNSSIGTMINEYPQPIKPRIATIFWEKENTMCYQVEARGVLVSRRGDTNYINGTKLLNVIGMTRGKRDGILKAEKNRSVVKIGSMNLKGVWIPFERAAEIARNEGIDNEELLGPLFVKDISNYYRKGNKSGTEYAEKSTSNDISESTNYSNSNPYGNQGSGDIVPASSRSLAFKNEYFETRTPPSSIKEGINYYSDNNKTQDFK